MKIRFLGPLDVVTGSCTWMQDTSSGWNFLIDCGMQQGEFSADDWNRQRWPFKPAELKFVVLTHAHLDHCGLLPKLYRDGFRGTVYCTAETASLAKIVLEDAARQHGAPFKDTDVARIRWHEPGGMGFGQYLPVDNNLFLRFFRSGHIVGAVSVAVLWGPRGDGQRSIVFSGDLGPNAEDAEHLPFMRHRMEPVACDFAVIESTYGSLRRPVEASDPEVRRGQLRALVDRTVTQRGALVLPCFAIGRTQDVVFDLHWLVAEYPERYQDLAVYFDAPMAAGVAKVVAKAMRRTESNGKPGKVRPLWLGKQMFRWLGLDQTSREHMEELLKLVDATLAAGASASFVGLQVGNEVARNWRPLLTKAPKRGTLPDDRPVVIITGGGMCDGGPIAEWLPAVLGNPNATVALTGYVGGATIGGQLMKVASASGLELQRHTGRLEWSKTNVFPIADIAAKIERLAGYSAHADQRGLLDWLFWEFKECRQVSGRTVFVQHGNTTGRAGLLEAIKARGLEHGLPVQPVAPGDPNVWYDLDANGAEVTREARRAELLRDRQRLFEELALLDDEAA